jgi:hypothetical protein
MLINDIRYELQNILSGKNGNGHDAVIQTIANHLRTSQRTSPVAEEKHQNKTKEAERLLAFAQKNNLIFNTIDQRNYISEGAEQKVYNNRNEYVILAEEKGYNVYKKVADERCKLAQEWWKEHQDYWALVKAEWQKIFEKEADIELKKEVDGKPIFMHLFALQDEEYSSQKINETIMAFMK